MAKKTARKRQPKPTAVAIAKDVLALLETKKIRAKTGVYFDLGVSNEEKFPEGSLQTAMHSKNFKTCDVCGVGAMFMAYVDRNNKIDVSDIIGHVGLADDRALIKTTLGPYISENQLDLIESFFENSGMNDEIDPVIDDWNRKYQTPRAMLKAICENMIANKGIFKPSATITVDFK